MRPTYLQLRSPKERTEYTTERLVSHHGTRLFHDALFKCEELGSPRKQQQKSFCFAPSNRFSYYKRQDRRVPSKLGPGSYEHQDAFKKLVTTPCSVKVKHLNTYK